VSYNGTALAARRLDHQPRGVRTSSTAALLQGAAHHTFLVRVLRGRLGNPGVGYPHG
jgi:hypothetical protein